MAIFTNTAYENTNVCENVNVEPTMEGSAQIMYEFASDIYKTISATYISDIMIESAISEGATNIEDVMEKTVSDFAKTAKEKFIKLKDKIKEWFKRIKDKFKAFFLSAEKFVQKYEKQILDNLKLVGRYKYYGYKYDDNGPCALAEKKIGDYKAIVDEVGTSVEKGEADRVKDKLDNLVGKDGVSAMKDEFKKEARGGQANVVEISVNESTAKKMINAISSHKVVIDELNKLEAKTERSINDMIAELNKKSPADIVTKKVTLFNDCIIVIQGINTVAVSEENTRCKQYHAALKKILFAKKTESFEGEESTEGSSIFESALNMLA